MKNLAEKEKIAIARLRAFAPEGEPYYLCYSGGKDSDCIRILAELAGVNYELHHNLTTVDAPETIWYVKSIPGMHIDKAVDKNGNHVTMWQLIVKKGMPPTRLARYCCEALKEQGGKGGLKITGVRMQESRSRKENAGLVKILKKPVTVQKAAERFGTEYKVTPKNGVVLNMDDDASRRLVEHCYRTTSVMVNPILDWDDSDVWAFLHHYGCQANPLYQCGKKRIGCIGCPMQGGVGMRRDFAQYPGYKQAYIRAFDRMLAVHPERFRWQSGLDVYKWWVGDNPDQLSFFGED